MILSPDDIAKDFAILRDDDAPLHYLDNAAMALCPDVVAKAEQRFNQRFHANVKRGVHKLAAEATDAYDKARTRLASYLGSEDPREVVFTSGTTAAINIVALGLTEQIKAGDEIVVSEAEHHSNIVPWQLLAERTGAKIVKLPVLDDGRLDPDFSFGPGTRLVALAHVSNVTGHISPIAAFAKAARAANPDAQIIVDGAQAVPHGPVDVTTLDCDFYAFSGHKMFGPTGIGVLWGRYEALDELAPAFGGGGMIRSVSFEGTSYAPPPDRFEAGTPPVGQAMALAQAADWTESHQSDHVVGLAEQLVTGLKDRFGNEIRFIGEGPFGKERYPIISFALPGLHPHDICQILGDQGIATRGGHHCAQPLMDRFGVTGTVRNSLAPYNNQADIDACLAALDQAVQLLRPSS